MTIKIIFISTALHYKLHFETEAYGNSEMAYSSTHVKELQFTFLGNWDKFFGNYNNKRN